MLPALLALVLALGAPAADLRALDDGQGGGPGYRFEPARLEAAPGETILVENAGQDVHTVSHDVDRPERLFDEQAIGPGQTRDLRAPATPGEYPFKCAYHPEMTGTLVVAPRAPTEGASPTEGAPYDPPVGEPTPYAGEDAVPAPGLPLALVLLAAAARGLRRR